MSFRRSAAVALAAAAAAALAGCPPKVEQQAPPSELVIAAFNAPVKPGPVDPLTNPNVVPTPNDLALQAWPTLTDPALAAQKALLQAFVAAGGFPSDQAVPISIPVKRLTYHAGANRYEVQAPPALQPCADPSVLATTGSSRGVVVLRIDVNPPVVQDVEIDPGSCTTGQLGLVKMADATGSRAWKPGRYVFALRTGAVKTTTGHGVGPDQGIALVAPNKDLANPNNQPPGGLPASLVPQLEAVRASLWHPTDWNDAGGFWVPTIPASGVAGAFPAVAKYIPADQVAAIATFEVAGNPASGAPPSPVIPVDAESGIAPLPIDLLRTANHGTTIAFNPAFGPAAEGLTTLDGFSTTAMMLAQVTFPLDASTVNGSTVHVFKIRGGTISRLKELKQELGIFAATSGAAGDPTHAEYVAEPNAITTTTGNQVVPGVPCAVVGTPPGTGRCSVAIGLQPAVGAPVGAPFGTINLPPLEEDTDYAVVITTSVKDMIGRPFQKSTVAKLLIDPGFDAIATSSVDGTSLLAGISDETATALQKMREQLVPVLAAFRGLPVQLGGGKTDADVALAYTFRTQSVKKTSLSLVGLPYGPYGAGIASEDPAVLTTLTPAVAAAQYGFDVSILPTAAVPEIAEVKMRTVSLLLASQNQGAFDPDHLSSELVTAVVAIPDRASVTGACPDAFVGGAYAALGITNCAPLVVFEHGITDSKAHVLLIAGALAQRGFVVVGIDQALRGDRSYCSGSGANAKAAADQMCCPAALCGVASTCSFKDNLSTSVDFDASGNKIQIGVCETAPGVRGRMLSYKASCYANPFLADGVTPNPACLSPKGTAYASANRLLSLNFFRLRDTFRQDVVDQSALVRAFAPIGPSADAFAAYLAGKYQMAVDFQKVYVVGHSGGAISGTQTLALNPRISRAVTYASGATFVDIANNPTSHFHKVLVGLLPPGQGEGTPGFLKLLQVAKWILDPAEPANYAPFVRSGALPPSWDQTPLPSPFAFPPFDTTPLNAFWPSQPAREMLTQISFCDTTVPNEQNTFYAAMLGLTLPPTPGTTASGRVQWYSQTAAASSCGTDAVNHGNIIDFALYGRTDPTLTQQAQSFAAGFLQTPANVVTPVTP
jgi:pimeloyl-ACP methyl ester carboxylesterase